MTFSIICVYNDEKTLSDMLETGLEGQTYNDFETVFIDNRGGEFNSAAAALNAGAKEATGDYYVFIHQDVKLPSGYLAEAKEYLDNIDNLGVAGAAGVRETGSYQAEGVNMIQHGEEKQEWERGTTIAEPTDVDSIDELLLIVPQEVFNAEPFSTSVCPGWHLYGVEYSMRMKQQGKNVKVLPLDLWHRSDGGWRGWKHDLTLLRVIHNYPDAECIHTTGGSWPATRRYGVWRLIDNKLSIPYMRAAMRSWHTNGSVSTMKKAANRLISRAT